MPVKLVYIPFHVLMKQESHFTGYNFTNSVLNAKKKMSCKSKNLIPWFSWQLYFGFHQLLYFLAVSLWLLRMAHDQLYLHKIKKIKGRKRDLRIQKRFPSQKIKNKFKEILSHYKISKYPNCSSVFTFLMANK